MSAITWRGTIGPAWVLTASEVALLGTVALGLLSGGCGQSRPPERAAAATGRPVETSAHAPAPRDNTPDPFSEGVVFQNSGDLDTAAERFSQAIELDPDRTDAYLKRAWIHITRGDAVQAAADYDTVVRLEPDRAESHMHRAVFHQATGQIDLAMADCNRALELEPEKLPGAYSFRANLWIARGEFEKAVQDCNTAVRLSPRLHIAYSNRGVARHRLGQNELAVADFTQAIDLFGQFAEAYNNRAAAYVELGKVAEAVSDLTEAIRLDPGKATPYGNRGALLLEQGETAKAIADLSRMIQLVDRDLQRTGGALRPGQKTARVYALRARAYLVQGDRQRAAADCEQALKIDAACPEALAVRQELTASLPAAAPTLDTGG